MYEERFIPSHPLKEGDGGGIECLLNGQTQVFTEPEHVPLLVTP